jgi:hypothetical protein
VPLQLLRQEDGHRLALARPTRDPQQARVAVAISITVPTTIAVSLGAVASIVCNPITGVRDSRAFRVNYALAVDVGICEEERVATSDGRLL